VGTVFGDEVLAAAILDPLLHLSFTLMVQGESYRLKQKRKTALLGRAEKSN
jgi:DNA replication protein DnaC